MSTPLVTIVVPAYNVEKYIALTLESIQKQTLIDFECVIVDDCATDGTRDVCMRFVKTDKRFKLIPHRENAGLSAARNTGLRFAQGKYICFLDSDDLLMYDSLDVRSSTLESSKDLNVIGTYCGSLSINEDCKIPPKGSAVNLKMVDFITAGGNCPFNANQPMFKLKEFKTLGGFNHALKQAEDYDMWMRVLREGYSIIPTNKYAVTYRATPGSMIKKNPLLHLDTSYNRFRSCYDSATEYQIPSTVPRFSRYLDLGLNDYLAQLNIANRVLEFVGIAIGVGDTFALEQKLLNYLPDYFKIIEDHRPFINNVMKGVNRALGYNVSTEKKLYESYINQITYLYEKFKLLYEQQLKSAEKAHHSRLYDLKRTFMLNQETLISQIGAQELIDVIFIPHKDYHVATINSLRPYLEKIGLQFIVVDISMHYRDEGVKRKAEEVDLPLIGYSNFLLGSFKPKLIICFNDWDPIVRSILVSAQKSGIKTSAIVEGIQDYLDADTKQIRFAYKTADSVYLPGNFDIKYFEKTNQHIQVVGLPRIHEMRMWSKNSLNWKKPKALINSNFSYGVLEQERDRWVKDAVEACLEAGFEPIISRHPADKGTEYMEYQTSDDFYDAIKYCEVHISKFASGILEALAVGCPVIYYNVHKENVDKFKSPLGAYAVIENKKSLIKELKELPKSAENYLLNAAKFLNVHAGNANDNSAILLTQAIHDDVQSATINETSFQRFVSDMLEIDRKTGCFNNLKYLRESFDATYSKGAIPKINIEQKEIFKVPTGLISEFKDYLRDKDYKKAEEYILSLMKSRSDFGLYFKLLTELVVELKNKEQPISDELGFAMERYVKGRFLS